MAGEIDALQNSSVKRPFRSVDRAISDLAGGQRGLVTRRQLEGLGQSRGQICHRLAVGRLHRVHRGVYAVGLPASAPEQRWLAAVLRCGPAALLSHRDAIDLFGLEILPGDAVHVTDPGRGRRPISELIIHRSAVPPEERRTFGGIPVVSPARALLDVAPDFGPAALRRLLEETQRRELFSSAEMERLLERHRGGRGVDRLRRAWRMTGAPVAMTRSAPEARLAKLCRSAHLPAPALNVPIGRFEVDAYWPKHALVVELDSRAFHGTGAAIRRDHDKTLALQRRGLTVLRLMPHHLEEEWVRTRELLVRHLGAA